MRRMFGFEIRKLYGNKLFCWFSVLFLSGALVLPGVQIFLPDENGNSRKELSQSYQEYTEMPMDAALEAIREREQLLGWKERAVQMDLYPEEYRADFWRSLEEESGMDRVELVRFLEDTVPGDVENLRGELARLETVQNYISSIAGYEAYRESIFARRDQMESSVFGQGGAYAGRLAQYTAEAYEETGMIVPEPSDPEGVLVAMGDQTDILLCCAVALLFGVFLFLAEKGSGVEALVLTARNGRRVSWGVRTVVAVLGSSLFCLFLLGSRLCWSMVCIGLGDIGRPLQSVPGYYASAWSAAVWQLLIMSAVIKTGGTALVALVFSTCCYIWDGTAAWCGMVGSIAVSYAAGMIKETSVFQPFRYLNLISAFQTELYGGTALFLKFGQWPVPWSSAAVSAGVFLAVLCISAGVLKKTGLDGKGKSGKRKRGWNRGGKIRSPFLLELKKLLVPQYGYFVLLLVLLLQGVFWHSFYSRKGTVEQLYEAGVKQVQGIYTDEKDEQIQTRYQEMLAEQDSYQSVQVEAMARLAELSGYLQERSRTVKVQYLYETGYEMLLGLRLPGSRYQPLLIALSLVLLLGGISSIETESGMEMLCTSTQGIEELRKRKLGTAMAVTVCIVLVNWLPEMLFAVRSFPVSLKEMPAPAVSVQSLVSAPGWLPLGGAVAWVAVVRLLGAVLTMLVVAECSRRSQSYLAAVLKSMAVVAGEMALYMVLPGQWKLISLFGLLAGAGVCDFSGTGILCIAGWLVVGIVLYRKNVIQN